MEEDGDESHICRRRIHEKASQDGEVYQANGSEVQKGECYAPYVHFPPRFLSFMSIP